MPTLSIVNWFKLASQGLMVGGKQGAIASDFETSYDITTVAGANAFHVGSIATGQVNVLHDASGDYPATWSYFWLWCDQAAYLQVMSNTSQFILPVTAFVPISWPGNQLLGAVNTTLMTVAPALQTIDRFAVGNFSGSTLNYVFGLVG